MDLVRPRSRLFSGRTYVAVGAGIFFVALVTWAVLSISHQQGGVVIDRATIVTDIARRGTLLRSVAAQGAFAPERVRVVSATQPGVVNEIFVKPGSVVAIGTVVAQMENPQLAAAVINARSALQVAEANLADARQQGQAVVITQQSNLSDARAQLQSNTLQARSYESLHRQGMIATLPYRQAQIQVQKSENDVRNSRAQVDVAMADAQSKVAAAQAQVEEASAELYAAQAQVGALTVRAATPGVVQSVDVDPGVSVAQNSEIARIADLRDLKAVLQVAETDVHSVALGVQARVDTGNGVFVGRVSHIAPASVNGTVPVDVTFARAVPGARPDANVDGTIVLDRIPNAISIARPANAADGSTVDLFKVDEGGARAVRVHVRLGQGSNERVQVLYGVAAGDTVIISDMSNYSGQNDLRLR